MILLLDTTTNPATIGLWNGELAAPKLKAKAGKLITETIELNPDNNRRLISIIQKFIKSNIHNSKFLTHNSIDAIGVINGPGTFSGVRTGVVIANAMAYALKVPIYAIDTLLGNVGAYCNTPLQNAVSLLSASNTEVFFARFKNGKMQGKIEIVDVVNNLPNRIKPEDLIVGDLQQKHCGAIGINEFKMVTSKERIEGLLQMIPTTPRLRRTSINNKIKPQKMVLPLYIKKPNITQAKKKK